MGDTAKTLLGTFGMTDFLIPLVLEDVSDEDARKRSRDGKGPSIAWMVGHLLYYRHHVMSMLGHERVDPHGDTFTRPATDGSDYPTLAELQEQWGALATDFPAVFFSKTADDWNARREGARDKRSLRDQVNFFAWHEGYHMGALGALLKEMGYPGPAEKVRAARRAREAGA
jgi:uncharacterized damage-inducible protein DinB